MNKKTSVIVAIISAIAVGVLAWPHSGAAQSGGRSPETKLIPSDAAADDHFGVSVAVSGDTAVVGASGDDDAGRSSGSAYVYMWDGTAWIKQAKLTASDAAPIDNFGGSVAIAGDTIVVGASLDDDADTNSGSVYVFVRDGTTWTEQANLTASDAAFGDVFGNSVAIAGDTIVVGARDSDGARFMSGSAYVYARDGTSWTEQAKLTASDGASDDRFGNSVAIAGDTIVVGASDNDDAGSSSGSAYVFGRYLFRDGVGTAWVEQAKLTASDAAAGDQFGVSVAIAGDTVVVGARGNDDAGSDSGSAYVFGRDGTAWTEQAKLTASDAAAGDHFGWSVAIAGDTIVAGAYLNDDRGLDSGSAYVYVWDGTSWTEQAKLTASDAASDDQFGLSVAISGDTVVVGAYLDNGRGHDSGSAYVYQIELIEFCDGRLVTHLGTDGDDVIEGTNGPDVIHGFAGNDIIHGLGGNDVICGGDSDDAIQGRDGNDILLGGAGSDTIYGDTGNDRIFGGAGNDYLTGGLGFDVVKGDQGDDYVAGGWGDGANDLVAGGPGNDRLFGGDGDDQLWGGAGFDRLFGGEGADVLRGGDRWDLLRGGSGNDILYGDRENPDPVTFDTHGDNLFGQEGDDQLFGQEGDDDLDGGPDTDTCDGGPGTNTVVNCE